MTDPRRPTLLEEWCARHGFDARELRETAEHVPRVPRVEAPSERERRQAADWVAERLGHDSVEALSEAYRS